MVISRIRRVKILPRFASSAPFLCLIVAHLEWPDMGTSTASELAVTLAAKGEYSTYAGGFLWQGTRPAESVNDGEQRGSQQNPPKRNNDAEHDRGQDGGPDGHAGYALHNERL